MIDLNPPVRYRIPAQKFLAILESDSCRARSHELWPAESEVTLPDPDEPSTTPSPDFRPLSPILDFMSQARWYLQQHGCSSAHYVEITEDGRYQVVKRNLLVDKLQPILDQYGYLAVQSVLLRYRPAVPAQDPICPVPVIKEVKLRPGVPGKPPDRGPSSEQPPVPKSKTGKRDRREYHREYRKKLKEKLTMVQDTNDLLKEEIEKNKTPSNPDGTGTPLINDAIQVMVTDADKISGQDSGTHVITDPDINPTDDNIYGIEPGKATGQYVGGEADTVTPVVNQSTTVSTVGEILPTDRDIDEDALRANRNADETPVTTDQPVPDPISEPKKDEAEPEAPVKKKQPEAAQKTTTKKK